MLKLLVQIQCDGCDQLFQFARVCEYGSNSISFNSKVLCTMLSDSFWSLINNGNKQLHFCQGCYNDYNTPDGEVLPTAIADADNEIPF